MGKRTAALQPSGTLTARVAAHSVAMFRLRAQSKPAR